MNRSIRFTSLCAVLALGSGLLIRTHDAPLQHSRPAADDGAVTARPQPREEPAPPAPTESGAVTEAPRTAALPRLRLRTHEIVNPDGTLTVAYAVEPATPAAPHPYAGYDDETLAVLAYGDAEAAEVLALRLRERDAQRALRYALRAAALSGRNSALQNFANASPEPVGIDGRPVLRALRERYVLSALADALQPDRVSVEFWEARIRREFPHPEHELQQLRREAARLLDEMRQVQIEVNGRATIGGLDDA